jgi:hypothetical protein
MANKPKPKTNAKKAKKAKPAVKGGKEKNVVKQKPAPKAKAATKKTDTLSPGRITKTLNIMAALNKPEGVTIDEMMQMTGWLPHTARAYLSGVRKKLAEKKDGSQIIKYTRDGKTMYKLENPQDDQE